jgi:hypothetical protein
MKARPANRLPRPAAAAPDPPGLSALLLAGHGILTLGRIQRSDAFPFDLVAVSPGGWPVLVAVAGPAERLDRLVRLLGNDDLGEMIRKGCHALVLSWSRNARGDHVGEVVSLTPADYRPI